MQKGIVKCFNNERGYGFITNEEDGKDIFVHYSDIVGDGYRYLNEGESVSYTLGSNEKGEIATNVVVE